MRKNNNNNKGNKSAKRAKPDLKKMTAVILAGGFGTRLSEETHEVPKPMIEIGGMPVLWHIMNIYSSFGVRRFIICAGYKSWAIKNFFLNYHKMKSSLHMSLSDGRTSILSSESEDWDVSVVETGEQSMTGGRLRRVSHLLPDNQPFLFTYGDAVSSVDIAESVKSHWLSGKEATVTTIVPKERFGRLNIDKNGTVTGFFEKKDLEESWINAGFFVLEKTVINRIEGDYTIWEEHPIHSLTQEGELHAFKHYGFWQCMDTLREVRQLRDLWSGGDAPWAK